ncbi:MAG: Gfo/Idh/MocA family oxidoreductase [Actinobacteria bacterium]|nr:Gfo/Idh/MocA family oxidoreductase [Actinomycetota bacterium]
MAGERARIGVIGTGWWSTYTHLPGLLGNPSADLVALCDRSAEALERAAKAFPGPRTFTDLDAMLAEARLDGVVVATPHATHQAIAARCLDAGLHLMLEKPMSLVARDARDLVARARNAGRELIVGYPWHFTSTAKRARELITSGALGRPQHVVCLMASMAIEFYRGNDGAYQPVFKWTVAGPGDVYADPKRSGGGQGHLQVTHSSGLMFFVSGLQAQRVSAVMNSYDVPVDLVDAISVQFEGGAVGVVGSTGNLGVGDAGQLDIRVYCERGYVLLDAITGGLRVRHHDGTEERIQLAADATYPRFATAANLVDVCLGRAPNGSSGEIALRSVELLDAAYRSAAARGASVSIGDL